jgi:hypothetical protein
MLGLTRVPDPQIAGAQGGGFPRPYASGAGGGCSYTERGWVVVRSEVHVYLSCFVHRGEPCFGLSGISASVTPVQIEYGDTHCAVAGHKITKSTVRANTRDTPNSPRVERASHSC